MGEEIADVAGDVSAMASKQYSRAQDMAVEAFYDAHAAMKRNPRMAVAIALGFLVRGRRVHQSAGLMLFFSDLH